MIEAAASPSSHGYMAPHTVTAGAVVAVTIVREIGSTVVAAMRLRRKDG